VRLVRTTVSAAVLAVMLAGGHAHAAVLTVNPTRIVLSAQTASVMLTVSNSGDAPVRLQVKTHSWSQTLDGKMELGPTEDVVVFPSMVTLGPGEARRLRVAVVAPAGHVEKAYRVFLEELAPVAHDPGAFVRVLTRIGIPVFLQPVPTSSRISPTRVGLEAGVNLTGVGLEAGVVRFQIDNRGTTHVVPDGIRVKGVSATGLTLVDESIDGWYILAEGARQYELRFGAGDCASLRVVLIKVQVGRDVLQGRLETPSGACAP
jgi:fimbrial chaperone protein